MNKDKALDLALEALEESVDLVREDYENAKKLYSNYPSRQARLLGLEDGLSKHEAAITAIKQARSAPVQEPAGCQRVECMGSHGCRDWCWKTKRSTTPPAQPAPVQEPADGTQVSKVWWDGEKLMAKAIPLVDFYKPVQDITCSETLRAQGKAYPRTCRKCGKGPCIALANAALDKMAENARELGLDYEPDLQAELEATNRQVEILSDALAESRHEVVALKVVQEPVGALILGGVIDTSDGPEYEEWDVEWNTKAVEALQEKLVTSNGVTLMLYTTPPAQPVPVPLTRERVKEICAEAGYDTANVQARTDFINGIRHGEAAHGITVAPEKGQP